MMSVEYKSDATRGKSLINPERYKGDALVQVWLDSRLLATLSVWLDKQGQVTRFMSDVIKEPLRVLVEHLVEDGEVELVDDTQVARALLSRKYHVNLNPHNRGGKNLMHNIVLSERRKEIGDRLGGDGDIVDVDRPLRTAADQKSALIDEAVRRYEEIEEEKQTKALTEDKKKISGMNFMKDEEAGDA